MPGWPADLRNIIGTQPGAEKTGLDRVADADFAIHSERN